MLTILTIGNSFAGNATQMLPQIANAGNGEAIMIGATNLGGCSLEKHCNVRRQCERFPDVKPYAFPRSGRDATPSTLIEALRAEAWDYVTLQQASILSWRPETYEPWFSELLALVRELAPQAQPLIHQTWAYRSDAPFYAEQGFGQAEMHRRVVDAYAAVAEAHQLPVIPVGEAFALARAELGYVKDPGFDFDHPEPGALPDQSGSLVIGWRWQTGNTPDGHAHLGIDPKHCSPLGLYLGAATWYERITGQPIADNGFQPWGVSEAELPILRAAAHRAVAAVGGAIAV